MSSRRVVKKKTTSKEDKKMVKKGRKTKTAVKEVEDPTEAELIENIDSDEQVISKMPISDDTLDYLDSQVDELNDTNNLSEKIAIHRRLDDITKNLVSEIDSMVDIIDKVDQTFLTSELLDTDDDDHGSGDVNDSIVKLEKMIEGMQEEDSMQVKIEHYKRITEVVKRCKAKCTADTMSVAKCN